MNTDSMVSALKNIINIQKITGSSIKEVTGLAYDSREVKPGFIFFALRGLHTDGHKYIPFVADMEASIVFHSEELSFYNPQTVYIKVTDTRIIMAPVSALFYNYPADKLTCIGVTGTDGKSTTVSLIHQLLSLSQVKAGFISTVQYDTGSGAVKNHYRQSTPEATEIHKLLAEMVDQGCTHAVIEATSHGLSPANNRLGGISFTAGVLTNISHEHLEFHKTLERYIDDKANLFRSLNLKNGVGIVNGDEPFSNRFTEACPVPVLTYSLQKTNTNLRASHIREKKGGEQFSLTSGGHNYQVEINLPGTFNIENTLAALLTVSQILGTEIKQLLPFLVKLHSITGRMNYIDCGQGFLVLVDYAHTPGAYNKLFPMLRAKTKNKIIAVFGSAGERDMEKRAIQGTIADTFADRIILTDEDPRGEEPMQILQEIAKGCTRNKKNKTLFLIPDRKEAIRFAFSTAAKNDLVLLLGKGHENSIIYKDGPIPWNEQKIAISVLHTMGWMKGELE